MLKNLLNLIEILRRKSLEMIDEKSHKLDKKQGGKLGICTSNKKPSN